MLKSFLFILISLLAVIEGTSQPPTTSEPSLSNRIHTADDAKWRLALSQLQRAPIEGNALFELAENIERSTLNKLLDRLSSSDPLIDWDGKSRLVHAFPEKLMRVAERPVKHRAFVFDFDRNKRSASVYFDHDIGIRNVRFRDGDVIVTTVDGHAHLAFDTDQFAAYIVSSYRDRKGNLWFGTMSKGAIKIDADSSTYYSTKNGLPSDAVTSFAEDSSGTLWIGTQNGIARFDGKSFTPIGTRFGLPREGGNVFVEENGTLWANMIGGVYRLNGDRFEKFAIPVDRRSISSYAIFPGKVALQLKDSQGNLWFGTDGYGVLRFDGKDFSRFSKADGLCSNNITNIVEDQKGNIWISCIQSFQPESSGDGGLCRFNGKSFESFPHVKGLDQTDIYTIFVDSTNQVWIGASGHGVYRYDGQNFHLLEQTDRMDLTWSMGLQSVCEDDKGQIWLGFSGGLYQVAGNAIKNVTKSALFPK